MLVTTNEIIAQMNNNIQYQNIVKKNNIILLKNHKKY